MTVTLTCGAFGKFGSFISDDVEEVYTMGWRINKKQIRIKKSEDQEKTNKDQQKNKIVDFIVKLVEPRQVRGSKKTKSDSKLMKTYGNLEDPKRNKTGIKKNKI